MGSTGACGADVFGADGETSDSAADGSDVSVELDATDSDVTEDLAGRDAGMREDWATATSRPLSDAEGRASLGGVTLEASGAGFGETLAIPGSALLSNASAKVSAPLDAETLAVSIAWTTPVVGALEAAAAGIAAVSSSATSSPA